MQLIQLCESTYFRLNPRIRDEKTRHQYRIALRDFAAFLGHAPTLDDLIDDNVCGLMVYLLDRKLAPKTVNERRGRLNALWNWLARRGYLKVWPTTPPIPEPERTPQAWSPEQLTKLLNAVSQERVLVAGIPAPHWWRSLHMVAWDSGERISALLGCKWEHLQNEWLLIPAELRKGKKKDRIYKLGTDTIDTLNLMRQPERELIWPWPFCLNYLWVRYKIIRKRAGLPLDRYSAFHRMRKSVASYYEAAGGNATEFLGHTSRRVTQAYLDPKIVGTKQASELLFRIDQPIDKSPPPGKEAG